MINSRKADNLLVKRTESIGSGRPTTDSMTSYNNMQLLNMSIVEPRISGKSGGGSATGD